MGRNLSFHLTAVGLYGPRTECPPLHRDCAVKRAIAASTASPGSLHAVWVTNGSFAVEHNLATASDEFAPEAPTEVALIMDGHGVSSYEAGARALQEALVEVIEETPVTPEEMPEFKRQLTFQVSFLHNFLPRRPGRNHRAGSRR